MQPLNHVIILAFASRARADLALVGVQQHQAGFSVKGAGRGYLIVTFAVDLALIYNSTAGNPFDKTNTAHARHVWGPIP